MEIEFISDNISKKFQLNIQIENYFSKYLVDWFISVHFFILNHTFVQFDETEFEENIKIIINKKG